MKNSLYFLCVEGVVILLASPVYASDWGNSALTGKPQGFEPGQSSPVGDFGRGTMPHNVMIIDDGPRVHDFRTAPLEPIFECFPNDFGKPIVEQPAPEKIGKPISEQQQAELKANWNAWHKRVAALIYKRFNQSAQKLFKGSQPLSCQVGYMISWDGRVGQVRVLHASTNPVYDAMLLTTIRSIEHDPILVFPQGSKRKFIEKSGTFTWNFASHSLYGGRYVGNFDEEPLPYYGPKSRPEGKGRHRQGDK